RGLVGRAEDVSVLALAAPELEGAAVVSGGHAGPDRGAALGPDDVAALVHALAPHDEAILQQAQPGARGGLGLGRGPLHAIAAERGPCGPGAVPIGCTSGSAVLRRRGTGRGRSGWSGGGLVRGGGRGATVWLRAGRWSGRRARRATEREEGDREGGDEKRPPEMPSAPHGRRLVQGRSSVDAPVVDPRIGSSPGARVTPGARPLGVRPRGAPDTLGTSPPAAWGSGAARPVCRARTRSLSRR